MSLRKQNFRDAFRPEEFRAFRAAYEGINPDRPLETSGIAFGDTEPLFRDFLRTSDTSAAFVEEFLPQLGMFLQGPFPLPGNRVSRSAWDCRGKTGAYRACGLSTQSVTGKRTLDVGCNAGYDTFLMNAMGASESVGLEPHGFYFHAQFLNAVYERPGVSFRNIGWEGVDPELLGQFDLVTCLGLIYHLTDPMALLFRLASVMKPGARLVMETHVLSERSTHAHFVEGAFWGDETYWWIFGDECLSGMLRSAGFRDVKVALKADCDSRNPRNPRVTVEGHPAGARAWFTAVRS
jgi:SAM-dependent methyltransferase